MVAVFSLQMIPLFPKLFLSGSIHFKTDRSWILRLLYVGLKSDIDAEIYMKLEVLNLLVGFYSSMLADQESKLLILQVIQILLQISLPSLGAVQDCLRLKITTAPILYISYHQQEPACLPIYTHMRTSLVSILPNT